MSDEYLSKEEIKKWRSSVEKITLEEYAARLGKKLQEEKKTNDLADMLYTHYNPAQSPANYDTITKLEKIDLTPRLSSGKAKNTSVSASDYNDYDDDFDFNEGDMSDFIDDKIDIKPSKVEKKSVKPSKTVKPEKVEKSAKNEKASTDVKAKSSDDTKADTKAAKTVEKKEKAAPKKQEKQTAPKADTVNKKEKTELKQEVSEDIFSNLNITFKKSLTDREVKVLSYFVEKRGEIVYAKDLAELLDLKRDYIYKYIKNLRAKMSTDIIANADNGGFILN